MLKVEYFLENMLNKVQQKVLAFYCDNLINEVQNVNKIYYIS